MYLEKEEDIEDKAEYHWSKNDELKSEKKICSVGACYVHYLQTFLKVIVS